MTSDHWVPTPPSDPRSPPASSGAVRRTMQANRGRDTRPEVRLRSTLHSLGLRFFTHRRPMSSLRCVADVVFPSERVAVFVDGCWWHGCPQHGRRPRTNPDYWSAKFERNRLRDQRNDASLGEAGWAVVRAWEHEDPAAVAQRVRALVLQRRGLGPGKPPVRGSS